MTENTNPTFRDLTLIEAWRLIKRFFSAVLVCSLVFILPYVLYISGLRGADTTFGGKGIYTKWGGYLLHFVVLLLVVFHINDIFTNLAELFTQLAKFTEAMSGIKRMAFAILLLSYFSGWVYFPMVNFLVSSLVIIPAGFTYDEYVRVLRDKKSRRRNV